jgi:exodeoxyribonuclease VII large subunit
MTASILTVSQLNRNIRAWLENEMGEVQVEGEISNLSKPSSGHFYFSLKDSSAQIRCVYFKNRFNLTSDSTLENGQLIVARGILSLYEARGDYQLIVDEIKQAGEGNLFKQFEDLKNKLALKGLFEQARKKPFPLFPLTIGVITSPSGAALRDVLTTLARRYPLAKVVVYPTEVQGKNAHLQIIEALKRANQEQRCQVLLLTRGGGSIEDLWAFNQEALALAIAHSSIPIVSGVGHETDFTIADFVADLRAATPTAAAEAVTPSKEELIRYFITYEQKIIGILLKSIDFKKLLVHHAVQKIGRPNRLIINQWQHLDRLKDRLSRCMKHYLQTHSQHLINLQNNLDTRNPRTVIRQAEKTLANHTNKLHQVIHHRLASANQTLKNHMTTLHAVSPLATLDRGYSLVLHHEKIVVSSQQLKLLDQIAVKFAQGSIKAQVIDILE